MHASVPDREDMSWEIEELLAEQKVRFDALEEVCTSTQEVFGINQIPVENTLKYAEASGDAFTAAVNVVTISGALIGEMVARKIKGDK